MEKKRKKKKGKDKKGRVMHQFISLQFEKTKTFIQHSYYTVLEPRADAELLKTNKDYILFIFL